VFLQAWRFMTLLLAALGLTMGASHVLELPPRMGYDAQLYTTVTSTLYGFYAIIGGIIQVGSLLAAALLCWLVRHRGSFRLTLVGALCLALSLGLWAALVQPVNAEWARALLADPGSATQVYLRLRDRWEYGHVTAFAAWLIGFTCLLLSVLVEIPWDGLDGSAV
jgi:hypothetical protein